MNNQMKINLPMASLLEKTAYLNEKAALLSFKNNFNKRYTFNKKIPSTYKLHSPSFYECSLSDAYKESEVNETKHLFIYIHHSKSKNVNPFCMNVLCNQRICNYFIENNQKIWPWDISCNKNSNHFFESFSKMFGETMTQKIKKLKVCLIIIF